MPINEEISFYSCLFIFFEPYSVDQFGAQLVVLSARKPGTEGWIPSAVAELVWSQRCPKNFVRNECLIKKNCSGRCRFYA